MSSFRAIACRYLVSAFLIAGCAIGGARNLSAADTLATIKANGVLRLAVRADAPPFSVIDDAGKAQGYSVLLCEAVAAEIKTQLGLADLALEYVTVTAEDRFEAIAAGKADILCEATTATLARRAMIDFSVPTFISGAGLVIRPGGPTDFAALAGKKVGVLAGTTTEESLRSTLARDKVEAEVVLASSHDEGLATIERGDVDAYFADRTILRYLLGLRASAGDLLLADNYLTVEPYALGLPLGDDGLRLAIDRALSQLYRSGGIADIFKAAFGPEAKPTALQRSLYTISALPD